MIHASPITFEIASDSERQHELRYGSFFRDQKTSGSKGRAASPDTKTMEQGTLTRIKV